MNFSTVRGYNAYAQFTAKIRQAHKTPELQEISGEHVNSDETASSEYTDPVDTVTISNRARTLSFSLISERQTPQAELREWMRGSGIMSGTFTNRVSAQNMQNALSGVGLTFDEDEVYDINIEVWSAVSVTSRNAEKAMAIQDLLNSTPSGINWGFLLQKIPA